MQNNEQDCVRTKGGKWMENGRVSAVSKPGKSGNPPAHRRVARRCEGKMQSEDARVENHPVVRQVYRVGKVATPRGMIRFALGSLEVCEITDEITAGILGAEVTGNSATWLTKLKKKFFSAGNGELTSCPGAILRR